MTQAQYPHIFSPIKIGTVVFKNRIWSGPAAPHLLYNREGYPSDAAVAYYAKKAAGGAAVITHSAQNMDLEMEFDPVHAYENILAPQTQKMYRRFTDAIHLEGAKVSLELLAFSYHHVKPSGERVLLSVNGGYDEDEQCETEAFSRADFERIAASYGDVAKAALDCGYDLLLIHGGHGLCLSQFYSRLLNRRQDDFGPQTLENRMRFAVMILKAIRARVGKKLLIEYRISGEEDPAQHHGYTVDDCIEMVRYLQDYIDIAHISAGSFYNGTEGIMMPTEFYAHGCNVQYAAAVRACPEIHIPVLTLGALQEPEEAESILAQGKADIVAMVRGLIADADRVNKWRAGKADEAIPCIRCFHCLDYLRADGFHCSVNPTVGREYEYLLAPLPPHSSPKKVVVLGGGPAGMQAAITARQRGHEVTLVEKSAVLGGKLLFSAQVPFKQDLCRFMKWQIHMVQKLGVQVMLNTDADPETIQKMVPDALIAAVGAEAFVPPISGIREAGAITAEQAYARAAAGEQIGREIVVIGGGLVGCETALYLAENTRCRVTILEMLPEVAMDEMNVTRDDLLARLNASVTIAVKAKCTRLEKNTVFYLDRDGAEQKIACDQAVISAGMKPRAELAEQFRACAPFFESVGDCAKAANVRNATSMAYHAAMRI